MVFVLFDFVLILTVIIFGVITSYTDVKTGKIRNNHILLFIFGGILIYILFGIQFMINDSLNISFMKEVFWHFILAALFGYLFWVIGVWTPGDGKLYTVYALLVPLSIYQNGYIKNFSSYNILFNTFTPLFIFLFFNILIKSSKKKKIEALKKSFSVNVMLSTALSIFSYSWIISIISKYLGIVLNHFTSTIFMLILFLIVEKVFLTSSMKITLLLTIARVFIDKSWLSSGFLITFVTLFLVFLIFRFFVLELGFNLFSKDVKIKNLKEGMVMAEIFYEEEKKVRTKKAVFMSLFSYFQEKTNKNLIDYKSEGLTKKDIDRIKELQKKNPDLKTVAVLDTLPFAPFMFFGVIITLLFKGNFIIYLQNLI